MGHSGHRLTLFASKIRLFLTASFVRVAGRAASQGFLPWEFLMFSWLGWKPPFLETHEERVERTWSEHFAVCKDGCGLERCDFDYEAAYHPGFFTGLYRRACYWLNARSRA